MLKLVITILFSTIFSSWFSDIIMLYMLLLSDYCPIRKHKIFYTYILLYDFDPVFKKQSYSNMNQHDVLRIILVNFWFFSYDFLKINGDSDVFLLTLYQKVICMEYFINTKIHITEHCQTAYLWVIKHCDADAVFLVNKDVLKKFISCFSNLMHNWSFLYLIVNGHFIAYPWLKCIGQKNVCLQ